MNKQNIGWFLIGAVGFLIVVAIFAVNASANGKNYDNVPGHECEHGVHLYNPHCDVTPTVTPTEEVTPTPTEEVTPTATPTAEEHHDVAPEQPLEDRQQCTVRDCSQHPAVVVPSAPPSTGYGPAK